MTEEKKQTERRSTSPEIIAINKRLDSGDKRMDIIEKSLIANTEDTRRIAENTQGLVTLTTELEAGTRFLCRCALGIRFILKEVIEPFWKPALVVVVVINLIFNHQLPAWIGSFIKVLEG